MKKSVILWQTALFLLQTLTGTVLVLFGAFHLFGNSIINFGESWFNSYLAHLDHQNIAIQILIWLLVAGLAMHGLNGLRIILRYYKKIPNLPGFLIDTKYRSSFLWFAHFSTGIIMGIFVTVHLILACIGNEEPITTAEAIKLQVQNNYYFALMNLLLAAGVFHGCCGIRNIFTKYGILAKHRDKINAALLIIGVALVVLGVNNLFVFRG